MSEVPSISIAGAGNVAFHLGKALISAGIKVDRIFNRDSEKALLLSEKLGAEVVEKPEELEGSSLIICCISDAALAEWIPKLSKIAPTVTTSGTIDALAFDHKHDIGVFYPMQTFSGTVPADFSNIPIFIEASSNSLRNLLTGIGDKLSSSVTELSAEKRGELHVAAVFINNFTNHMVDLGQQFLEKHHLPFDYFRPLLEQTVAKLADKTAYEAQTGPARRNDTVTIEKHLAALEPEQRELYLLISNSIQKRYS